MRLILFCPADDELKELRDKVLAKRRKTAIIDASDIFTSGRSNEDKKTALGEALGETSRRHGYVIINPPMELADVKLLDRACHKALGKKGSPRAIFFIPRKKRRKQEEPEEIATYREKLSKIFHYYRRDRRAYSFTKAKPKLLRKAMKIANAKVSIIRWGAVVPLTLVFLAVLVGGVIFRDILLKYALVRQSQAIFGARTDVESLSTTFQPAFSIQGMAIANKNQPMRNLFQFDKLEGDMSMEELLSKRVHIGNFELSGLQFNTERTESGALPEMPSAAADEEEEDSGGMLADMDFEAEVEKVFKDIEKKLQLPELDDLETVKLAEKTEKEAKERWERLQALTDQKKLNERVQRAEGLIGDMEKIALPADVDNTIKRIQSFGKDGLDSSILDNAKNEIEQAAKIAFEQEKQRLETAKADLQSVETHVNKAQASLKRAQDVKNVDATNVMQVKGLIDDLNTVKKELDTAKGKVEGAKKTVTDVTSILDTKKKSGDGALGGARGKIDTFKKTLQEKGDAIISEHKALLKDVKNSKDSLTNLQKDVQGKIKTIGDEVEGLKDDIDQMKDEIESNIKFVEGLGDAVKNAIETDRKNLEDRYNFDNLNAEGLARAILGDAIAEKVAVAYMWYAKMNTYMGEKKKKKRAKTSRLAGTTFTFPVPEARKPALWIKKARMTGIVPLGTAGMDLSITGEDISSSPSLLGKNSLAQINASTGEKTVTGTYTGKTTGESVLSAVIQGIRIEGIQMKGEYSPSEISQGDLKSDCSAVIQGNKGKAKARLELTNLKLVPPTCEGMEENLAAVLKKIYEHLENEVLKAEITAEFIDGKMKDFKVETNLAGMMGSLLKEALVDQIESAKKQALAHLEDQLKGPREEALKAVNDFMAQANISKLLPMDKVGGLNGLLDARQGDLMKELQGKLGELDLGGDPAALFNKDKNTADLLSKQLNDVQANFLENHNIQSGALGGVQQLLGGKESQVGGLQNEVDGQTGRLNKMIKDQVKLPEIELPKFKF